MNRAERRRAAKQLAKAGHKRHCSPGGGLTSAELKQIEKILFAANRALDVGDYSFARSLCQKAIAGAPELPEAYFAMGTVHQESGDCAKASVAYRKAVSLRDHYLDAWINLANCHLKACQPQQAYECAEKALELAPQSILALSVMANACARIGDHERAVRCLKQATKLKPDSTELLCNLAEELRHIQDSRSALAVYEKIATTRPDWPELDVQTAACLQEIGDFAGAKKLYLHALEQDPENGRAYLGLAIGDTGLDTLDALLPKVTALAGSGNDKSQQVYYNFAAARIHEMRNEAAPAFAFYDAGNRLVHERLKINQSAYSDSFNRMIEVFGEDLIVRLAAFGNPSRKPIFIVGMPRSGTSLVEQILAAHPDVFGAGEIDEMTLIARELQNASPEGEHYLHALTQQGKIGIATLSRRYLSLIERKSGGSSRVVDKAPMNFMRLGLISILFPNATILHSRRNPMDTCLSCYFQLFGDDLQPYSYDQRDLGFFYQHYRRLMDHWRNVLPKPFLDVDYEALVNDPEPVVRQMLDFCGLEWNDACLSSHKVDRPVATASLWQVRQPIYKTSSGKWRQYEAYLGELKQALGPYGEEG